MVFLASLIQMYTLLLIAVVLISWFPVPQDNTVVRTLRMLTEPLLAPVRRLLPDMGGLIFRRLWCCWVCSFWGSI